jgi:hypothetical protein
MYVWLNSPFASEQNRNLVVAWSTQILRQFETPLSPVNRPLVLGFAIAKMQNTKLPKSLVTPKRPRAT